MHQSIPAAPGPPATVGHLPGLSASPGGEAGGRAFANSGSTHELLTRTWFPIRI